MSAAEDLRAKADATDEVERLAAERVQLAARLTEVDEALLEIARRRPAVRPTASTIADAMGNSRHTVYRRRGKS
jgi:hypothetical protein